MIIVPGQPGRDLCDRHLGMTRRDLLRVGGSGMLGLSLGSMFQLQAASARETGGRVAPGWGKAKSIIMVYLQGGPSHLDLWDPKENVPDNVRSVFKPIATKAARRQRSPRCCPKLSQVNDKMTMIRSMSYTPNGLFNHTAAIYQMMTGYTTDKVSPSGQLEPPSPKDFPNFGSNIIRLKPPTEPMLPFVMLPRPLQETNVVGKGGTAGFLGKAYDPYTLYPDGDDMDMTKMDRIKVDDLQLRPEVFALRLERRARLRDAINAGMPEIDKAVADYDLDEYYDQALSLIISGRAREAFNLDREPPQDPRPVRPQHLRPELPAGPAAGRGRHPRRRGHLAQGRQLRQPLLGPPRRPDRADEEPVGPDARRRPVGAARPTSTSAACSTRRWSSPSASSAAARRRASAPRATATAPTAATTGRIATRPASPAAGIRRGPRPRQVGQDGLGPAGKPGPSGRAAGDDLPRLRHRPGHDRLQPPEPAARAGQGRGRDPALRLIPGRGAPTTDASHARILEDRHIGSPSARIARTMQGR